MITVTHRQLLHRIAILGLLGAAVAIVVSGTANAARLNAGSQRAVGESLGWGAYGPEATYTGSFSVAPDGSVSGTLPPGYTKEHPPVDPAWPETAKRIQNSTDASRLHTFPTIARAAVAHRVKARAADLNPSGCVTAFSYIDVNFGLYYKGQMAGCSYGDLSLHVYLKANGVTVSDPGSHQCYSSTSCSVPYFLYSGAPNCREFINYAHGINHTTGGDHTAYQIHDPWSC